MHIFRDSSDMDKSISNKDYVVQQHELENRNCIEAQSKGTKRSLIHNQYNNTMHNINRNFEWRNYF